MTNEPNMSKRHDRKAQIEAVWAAFNDAMLNYDHSWGLPDNLKSIPLLAVRKAWMDAFALMRDEQAREPQRKRCMICNGTGLIEQGPVDGRCAMCRGTGVRAAEQAREPDERQ